MRYKFRGKRVDNGEWVVGTGIQCLNDKTLIIDQFSTIGGMYSYEVLDQTVGQFTGLKDRDGVDIYEGDLVQIGYTEKYNHEVVWEEYGAYFRCKLLDKDQGKSWNAYPDMKVKVIGSVHDTEEEGL